MIFRIKCIHQKRYLLDRLHVQVVKNYLQTCTYIFQFETHEWGSKRPLKFSRSLELTRASCYMWWCLSKSFWMNFMWYTLFILKKWVFSDFWQKIYWYFYHMARYKFWANWVWAKQSEIEWVAIYLGRKRELFVCQPFLE